MTLRGKAAPAGVEMSEIQWIKLVCDQVGQFGWLGYEHCPAQPTGEGRTGLLSSSLVLYVAFLCGSVCLSSRSPAIKKSEAASQSLSQSWVLLREQQKHSLTSALKARLLTSYWLGGVCL